MIRRLSIAVFLSLFIFDAAPAQPRDETRELASLLREADSVSLTGATTIGKELNRIPRMQQMLLRLLLYPRSCAKLRQILGGAHFSINQAMYGLLLLHESQQEPDLQFQEAMRKKYSGTIAGRLATLLLHRNRLFSRMKIDPSLEQDYLAVFRTVDGALADVLRRFNARASSDFIHALLDATKDIQINPAEPAVYAGKHVRLTLPDLNRLYSFLRPMDRETLETIMSGFAGATPFQRGVLLKALEMELYLRSTSLLKQTIVRFLGEELARGRLVKGQESWVRMMLEDYRLEHPARKRQPAMSVSPGKGGEDSQAASRAPEGRSESARIRRREASSTAREKRKQPRKERPIPSPGESPSVGSHPGALVLVLLVLAGGVAAGVYVALRMRAR